MAHHPWKWRRYISSLLPNSHMITCSDTVQSPKINLYSADCTFRSQYNCVTQNGITENLLENVTWPLLWCHVSTGAPNGEKTLSFTHTYVNWSELCGGHSWTEPTCPVKSTRIYKALWGKRCCIAISMCLGGDMDMFVKLFNFYQNFYHFYDFFFFFVNPKDVKNSQKY